MCDILMHFCNYRHKRRLSLWVLAPLVRGLGFVCDFVYIFWCFFFFASVEVNSPLVELILSEMLMDEHILQYHQCQLLPSS